MLCFPSLSFDEQILLHAYPGLGLGCGGRIGVQAI